MRLKDILVSLDPTRAGLKRLEVAARLAQRHGAEVIGFYGAPTSGHFTRCGDGIEAVAGTDVGENTLSAGEIAEEMRTRFEEALANHSVTGSWVLGGEPVLDDVVGRVRTVDLAVAGLGDPEATYAGPQGFRAEDLIMRCGRPVLGLPVANVPERIGRSVILAWDGSREASRAMHDALPLLLEADLVTVLAVDARLGSTGAAVAHLRRHGVSAAPDVEGSTGLEIGELILSRTEQLRADLLVAGAYGHSRLAEVMFGGVSRTLLHQMMIPVLVSH